VGVFQLALDKYTIRIDGMFLKGYDESLTSGKTGHMGWQPRAYEMPAIVLTEHVGEARVIEGNIELRSQIQRIFDRVRYGGLKFHRLEIVSVADS
jgi:hypothetical protein